jgi:MOSC domain-containing protein YiiM
MHTAPEHFSAVELEQCLPEVLDSPADNGQLTSIFVRPAPNERRALTTAQLSPERGIDGDRWVRDSFYKSENGSDPRNQVSLMNSRYLRTIAGNDDAMCLAGDNLIVDFDLSEAKLPAGSQLAIGETVIIEITDLPHTGCGKFQSRYGKEARAFTNNDRGKALHLRGRYARIITAGTIHVGDSVRKIHPRSETM